MSREHDQRVNEAIRAPVVRLIDADGTQLGIVDRQKALSIARERGLDLVEVAPNASPPVCRVMDYGKYRYEQSKKERTSRKKQHTIVVKEIRLSPRTELHDIETKCRHAREFLEQGNKVKVTVRFRGREMTKQAFGAQVMQKVKELLQDVSKVEKGPEMEGYSMVMVLAPLRTN
ncbi:MAG: translation initiation factor IF-3 [Calditrichaeota bacterium]|nr:translation initiation factor IF-3 [Calditrichota bacterium]